MPSFPLLSIAFGFIVLSAPVHAAVSRPPNIIFILVDDLGYGDIGAFGQKIIPAGKMGQSLMSVVDAPRGRMCVAQMTRLRQASARQARRYPARAGLWRGKRGTGF